MYDVVSVVDGMIGGHYAVKGPDGRLIGREFGLDLKSANTLSTALTIAFKRGLEQSGIENRLEPFICGSQMAREGQREPRG